MALGTAVHLALEEGHSEKKFDLDGALKIFLKDFHQTIHDDEIFIQYAKLKKMEADGIKMIENYAHDFGLGKFSYPEQVELEFSIPFEDLEIVGKIDRVDIEEDTLIVSDYKTGSKEPDPWFLRHNLQFTVYAWALQEKYGKIPDKIIWWHLRNGKRLETYRTQQDIDELKDLITKALFMHKNNIRYRIYHEAVCGWCDYAGPVCDDRELEQKVLDARG